jgi:NADPH-dependent 2,4-dienoyl-CoA reductase/sulfur reductase-like enzyme
MAHFNYLIVGGGMTADAAARSIRAVDEPGAIGVIGAEPDRPYNRPPLSKGLWKGEAEDTIWRKPEVAGVTLHLGRRVVNLDPKGKRVTDDRGTMHTFDRLLLATGGVPRRLPFESDQIIYFRTLADYRRLRALASQPMRCAVVGGGFIGSEVAAALRMQGREVVMLVPEAGLGARVFPVDLSGCLADYYREKGVEVRTGEGMTGIEKRAGKAAVRTTLQKDLTVDVVVAGLGIQPSVELAEQAGLNVENGIVVDAHCRSSHPSIFAAGDVANFHNPALDARMRVEHEDNANTMGKVAGENMAGQATPYDHLPFFYSDLFDLGYEAVGDLDARQETFSDWKEPFREGVVYYLKNGRVRGVLLWNIFGKVDAARALIAQPGPFNGGSLKGRICLRPSRLRWRVGGFACGPKGLLSVACPSGAQFALREPMHALAARYPSHCYAARDGGRGRSGNPG